MDRRYERNILLPEIGISGQECLHKTKVLVCGAGGLGSIILINLACLGIHNIGILDFDIVDFSNLNRQFIHNKVGEKKVYSACRMLKEFNPLLNITTYDCYLDRNNYEEIVEGYDIIVDCFDNYESKFLLNEISISKGIPLLHIGVEGYNGQVFLVVPKKTACLSCFLDTKNYDEKIFRGIISPVVGIVGNFAGMELVKYLLKMENRKSDSLITFDTKSGRIKDMALKRNPNCECCR